MQVKIDNCVNCGLPCLGNSCPLKNQETIICDCCECDTGETWYDDGEGQYCFDCFLKKYECKNLN